jgi:hypothetical protein
MSAKKIIPASAIGKTAFCPHAHYLSKKHPKNKASEKRMLRGVKKHDHLTKVESKGGAGALLWLVFAVVIVLAILVSRY